MAAGVDDDVADHQRPGAGAAAAAQQRLQAGGQLGDRERLDQVVVGAGLQAGDAVLDLVAGGEDADGDVDAAGAQALDDRHPVEVGHRHVEDDDSRRALGDRLERLAAAGGRGHGKALEAQRALEGLPDGGLVVDDEDEGGSGVAEARAPPRAEVLQRVLDLGLVELERLGERGGELVEALLVIGLVLVAQRLQRGLELGLADAELLGEVVELAPRGARGGRGGSSGAGSGTPARASASETPIAFARSARRSPRSPGRGGPCLRSESNASSTLDLLDAELVREVAGEVAEALAWAPGAAFSNAARTLASLMPSASASSLTCSSRRSPLGSEVLAGGLRARRAARPGRRRAWSARSLQAGAEPAAGPPKPPRRNVGRAAAVEPAELGARRGGAAVAALAADRVAAERRARRRRSGRGRCSLPWTSWS